MFIIFKKKGKSSFLIARANNFKKFNIPFIIIKKDFDKRYNDSEGVYVVTHDKKKEPAVATKNLCDLSIEESNIMIDEGQFFESEDLKKFLKDMLKKGKNIYIATLLTDFRQEEWPINNVIKKFKKTMIEKKSKCYRCGGQATHTIKLTEDTGKTIEVGGEETYQPCCTECLEIKK